ncbi:hypothetical protein B296_00020158, partial [Ensete ventricosum]
SCSSLRSACHRLHLASIDLGLGFVSGNWEMGQKLLIYSFVARGTMILAEYTGFNGNFRTIAAQCLEKLSDSNNKFTFNCDGHTFNYLVEDGYSECSGLRSRLLRVLDNKENVDVLVEKAKNLYSQVYKPCLF